MHMLQSEQACDQSDRQSRMAVGVGLAEPPIEEGPVDLAGQPLLAEPLAGRGQAGQQVARRPLALSLPDSQQLATNQPPRPNQGARGFFTDDFPACGFAARLEVETLGGEPVLPVHFCGEHVFQHELRLDRSSLTGGVRRRTEPPLVAVRKNKLARGAAVEAEAARPEPSIRLRDELLNETLFVSLAHARVRLAAWRLDYNTGSGAGSTCSC